MTTVQQIYDMAIHLMDEQDESTGGTDTVDTREYKFRTISILNTVIPALYPYSGDYEVQTTGRPVPMMLQADSYAEPDFDQMIPLDDGLAMGLLPLYLASQLLSAENEDLAAWFYRRYQENFVEMRDKVPASFQPIPLPYGLY